MAIDLLAFLSDQAVRWHLMSPHSPPFSPEPSWQGPTDGRMHYKIILPNATAKREEIVLGATSQIRSILRRAPKLLERCPAHVSQEERADCPFRTIPFDASHKAIS